MLLDQFLNNDLSIAELSKVYKCSINTIYRNLKELNDTKVNEKIVGNKKVKKIGNCSVCFRTAEEVKLIEYNGIVYCEAHRKQIKVHGEITNNKLNYEIVYIYHENHAELIMINKEDIEKARTLVSLDKIELIKQYKLSLTGTGYIRVFDTIIGKHLMLHRLLMDAKKDEFVDHINGNKLDNRDENLRICTKSQNEMNKKMDRRNKSGIKGVHWSKSANKWVARIGKDGKTIELGRYINIEDAAKARKEGEKKYFGEFTYGYFNMNKEC